MQHFVYFCMALSHFWNNLLLSPNERGYRFVDGTTYWNYRLVAESTVFALCALVLVGMGLWASWTPSVRAAVFVVALYVAAMGVLEVLRLRLLRRAQMRFEDLFYG